MSSHRKIHLNLFLGDSGHHHGAWRHPSADFRQASTIGHYTRLAQLAESAFMDSVFVADGLTTPSDVAHYVPRNFDPVTLLTSIAAHTSHIGLIGTMSTTFSEPYNLARSFASLDHVSGGRAGWNIVTTAEDRAANNFGGWRGMTHADRYRRAHEFVDVAKKLWNSWERDAIVSDAVAGTYTDPGLVHPIAHEGEWFQVSGALNIPRSPQGRPLLVQAGSSPDGRDFAAKHAEVVFTVHQTLTEGQEFYSSIKRRAAGHGRNPDSVKILPGIYFIIGDTEQAALDLQNELDELIADEPALALLNNLLGTSLTFDDLDRPLPPLPDADEHNGHQGRYRVIVEMARRENLTVRKLMKRVSSGRGHHKVVGTPELVADAMTEWADSGAADGFTLLPSTFPATFEFFVEHVVPILRKRGQVAEDYGETTLRDRFSA